MTPAGAEVVDQWLAAWRQTRQLTYDLLRALPYAVMNFSPHPEFGTFVRQIRHCADVQACYLEALRTGTMDLSTRPRRRELERSREHLEAYLRRLDAELEETVRTLGPQALTRTIRWDPQGPLTVVQHLLSLLQHETLHQGMWTFYARIADLPLPQSWWQSWALR
jgi:uncharacterized damage-inducible protein DinB